MVRYVNGSRFAVVVPGATAVFAPGLEVGALESIASSLRQGRGLGGVVEVLFSASGGSLAEIPDFALALEDEADAVRLVVRGALAVRVDLVDGTTVEVDGGTAAGWAERLIPGARAVRIGGETDATALPLQDGIVAAGAVLVPLGAFDAAAARPPAAPTEVAASEPEPEPEQEPAEPGQEFEPEPEPEPEAPPAVASVIETLAAAHTGETTMGELPGEPAVFADPQPVPAGPALPASTEAETFDDYDELLFGETRMSTVEDAAVRGEPDDGALIAGLPAFGAPAAPAPGPGFFDADEGDHDGETISAEQLRAMQGEAGPAVTPGVGAEASGAVFATLVVSTGERFSLDRGAVIGRRPRLTRVLGGRTPHLVSVPSPNQDVSRAHLEIRVEGSHVLAVDLDTTNGSRLRRAGQEPRRLQPSEPTLLVTGDTIDIGDGNVLSFEGLA